MNVLSYAGIFDRVKAVIIDSIILIILMYVTTDLLSLFDNVPNSARIIAFVCIFCLYDPMLTSVFGGTIGHKLSGIRVKQEEHPEKNIPFLLALLRYITKASLGWISLLTVSGHEKKKAIHDAIAGSVVVYQADKKES